MVVLTWKLKEINMDFVIGLPQTQRQNDSIWVIVDRLTKSTHFIPIKSTYTADDYARVYIDEIVSLHGSLCPSYRIEVLNSLLIFGGLSKRGWVLK